MIYPVKNYILKICYYLLFYSSKCKIYNNLCNFVFSTNRRSVPNLLSNTSLKPQPESQENSQTVAAERSRSTGRTTRSMSKDRKQSLNTSLTLTANTSIGSARSRTRSRNRSLNRSIDSSTRTRTRSAHKVESSPVKKTSVPTIKPKLTMPTTPTFMKYVK